MHKLGTRQQTQYPPLEQGQVLEMNSHCMKVNYGFKFVRGVFSGLIALVLFSSLVFDIIIGDLWTDYSLFFGFLDDIASFKYWVIPAVLVELYLWPSAPPMIFDRVNRRVIFQVLFRTKILDWDSCEGSIRYFAQATEDSATQGYNLRIEGDVINRKAGEKPQRATALIHQSGVSEDLYNYWEYIRAYMDGGPEAVPAPLKLNERNPFAAGWYAFIRNYPGLAYAKLFWIKLHEPEHGYIKKFFFLLSILLAPAVSLLAMPLVVPLFTVAFIAAKTGRIRRYPKVIRQLCKAGRESAFAPSLQPDLGKLKIHIDGKPLEIDWPAEALKPPSSTKPPLEE